MIVNLDEESLIPPYEQLRSQIATLIASGGLQLGARLPAIRQLAGDLGVAPGTVARTYRELEALGLVRAKRRGTFVSSSLKDTSAHSQVDTTGPLARAAETFALSAWQLGVPVEQALKNVREALERFPFNN
jgi:GntR family transcriptional regulator